MLANCGIHKLITVSEECNNLFWKNVIEAWYQTLISSNIYNEKIRENPLWFNDNIKINNKPVYCREWYKKGLFLCMISSKKMFFSITLWNFNTNMVFGQIFQPFIV